MVARKNGLQRPDDVPSSETLVKAINHFVTCGIYAVLNAAFKPPGEYFGTEFVTVVGSALIAQGVRFVTDPEGALGAIDKHNAECRVPKG